MPTDGPIQKSSPSTARCLDAAASPLNSDRSAGRPSRLKRPIMPLIGDYLVRGLWRRTLVLEGQRPSTLFEHARGVVVRFDDEIIEHWDQQLRQDASSADEARDMPAEGPVKTDEKPPAALLIVGLSQPSAHQKRSRRIDTVERLSDPTDFAVPGGAPVI